MPVLTSPRCPLPPPSPALLALPVAGCPLGCPFSLPAGTPFHAVCALGGLRPVALQVRATCPLRVCALVLPRFSRPPPPGLAWRAHHARFCSRALVGPFQMVLAPACFPPRSLALPS